MCVSFSVSLLPTRPVRNTSPLVGGPKGSDARDVHQQWLIGTYHGVSKAQLQVYLDEFVFRHNRRRHPMAAFQTLLGLGTGRAPTPYRRIRGAQDVLAAR